MGLDTTHAAWNGPYSAFRRFRDEVATAAGYGWYVDKGPRPEWDPYVDDNFQGEWVEYPDDPLLVFLIHSDCDGLIPSDIAAEVAARLEEVARALPDYGDAGRGATYREAANRFASGLRTAAAANEPLEFW